MMNVVYLLLGALAALAMALSIYTTAYNRGIDHALRNLEIYTVERYDPNDPDATARTDGTDQTVYIELDGEVHEYGMIQG